jgi:hypothetical protein
MEALFQYLASNTFQALPSVNLSSILFLIIAFAVVFGLSALIDRMRKPNLATTVDKIENNRLKTLEVYFSDYPSLRTSEAGFFFLTVTNKGPRTVPEITPKIWIPSMTEERELLIMEPTGKTFMTVKWVAKYEEFDRLKASFASALVSDEKMQTKPFSLDPKESKSFLVLLTLKDVPYVLTMASGSNLAYTKDPMPCVFDIEIFYKVKGREATKATGFRITAPNWEFPRDSSNVVEIPASSRAS